MKLVVLCIDKTRKSWLIEGEKEYITKLKKHNLAVEFNILQPIKNKPKEITKQLETEKVLHALLNYPDYVKVLLMPKGKEVTSEQFSSTVILPSLHSKGNLLVIIGGSNGLNYELLTSSTQFQLSLSQLTYLHEMVRVVLLEQVFRAMEISKGSEYHK
jgi:23S rRNA (pseudouridine1915-N3)-methyltransferase